MTQEFLNQQYTSVGALQQRIAELEAQLVTRSDAHLLRSHEALVLALTNCRNGLELLLQSHKPEHPDDPFDTINELRETVKNSTAALTEAAALEPQKERF
jgi:hypothetical protein